MNEKKVQIEALMMLIGDRGKFQIITHLLVASLYIIVGFNHVIMAFYAIPITHTCLHNANDTTSSSLLSDVLEAKLGYSAKANYSVMGVTPGQCSSTVHLSNGDNQTVTCDDGEWTYWSEDNLNNIVSEFDLVCSDSTLTSLATTIYFSGVMLGGLIFGDLADRFGRLPTILVCIYGSVAVGITTAFSVNYIMFVSLRFLTGFLMQGIQTSLYSLSMELYRTEYRPFAGAVAEVFFGSGLMILSCLAYLLKDWRHLQIAISLFGVFAFCYPWLVPESTRWLLTNGKMDKAEVITKKICRMNKIRFPEDSFVVLRQEGTADSRTNSAPTKTYNLSYLFRTPKLRKRTLVLAFIWFSTSACYYGMTFKMAEIEVDRYLMFFLCGAMETTVYACSMLIMSFFGRKKPLLCAYILAGVMLLGSGFVSEFTEGLGVLAAGLAMVGRCSMALVFGVIFVYTAELYPTVIRNIGMGFACFWARLGGMMAPQINEWGRRMFGFDVSVVFGVLSFLVGLSLLLLDETHNVRMANSIREVEDGEVKKKDVGLVDIGDDDKTPMDMEVKLV